MATLKLPQTSYIFGTPVVLGIVIGSLGYYHTSFVGDLLQGYGIILDIIGAIILSVPDVSTIQRYFFSGKLSKARQNLEWENRPSDITETFRGYALKEPGTSKALLDGLDVAPHGQFRSTIQEFVEETGTFGDTRFYEEGFYEMRDFLRSEYSAEVAYSGNPEHIPNIEWDKIYGFKVSQRNETLYFDGIKSVDNEPILEMSDRAKNIFALVDDYLDDCNSRFRKNGLVLLGLGFTFQLFSVVM